MNSPLIQFLGENCYIGFSMIKVFCLGNISVFSGLDHARFTGRHKKTLKRFRLLAQC